MERKTRAISASLATAALVIAMVAQLATGAQASSGGHKPPAVTKMTFKLDHRSVKLGTAVTGSVLVQTRSGNHWVALAGAVLSVRIDDAQVATITTDAAGHAAVSYTSPAAGGHVMRIVFAGDATHKACERSQGFEVKG